VCRQIGVRVMTLHRWRKRGTPVTESVHDLRVENRRLRDIAARLMLDVFALKESP
jgi:CHAD domain-containing protein